MGSSVARALAAGLVAAGGLFAVADAPSSQRGGGSDVRDARRGGTLRADLPTRFRFIDPARSFSWNLLHATHLYLLGYPDKSGQDGARVVPEAAGFPRVSRDGRTYTFTIRRGFRFSDGRPVTAAHFAHALNRILHPELQSPAATYVTDIVGAEEVLAGRARRASGISARGNVLTIRLERPANDFRARIAMPFFAAVPLNMPAEPVTQAPLPSAGPYYLKEFVAGRSALVVRNPYWRRSLLPRRPANVDQIAFRYGASIDTLVDRLERNETDLAPISAADAPALYRKYGLRGRFSVWPQMRVEYLFFNHARPLFRGNVRLRRAVNFAIDRPELARQFGFLSGRRTDQILPPLMPGFRDQRLYPIKGANVARARSLARGATRGGTAVMYTVDTPLGNGIAGIVKFNLAQIGIDVDVRAFSFSVFSERLMRPGEAWDIAWVEWQGDYGDPANFVDQLFDGRTIRPDGRHFNFGFFDVPAVNRRIAAVSRTTGRRREAAYAKLEVELMRDYAPVAPFLVTNERFLRGRDVGCVAAHPITASPNFATLCKTR